MNNRRKLKKGRANQPSRKITRSILPNEVEENILSRLPVKSLMRFRCVCKHWCNLVTKPHFIKMQLHQSTQIKEVSKLVFPYAGRLYSTNVGSCGKQYIKTRGQLKNHMQKQLVLPFRDGNCDMFLKIIGSCNGLLCLSAFDSLYLLNPVTKEYKRLPYPEILTGRSSSSSTILTIFGFGYSPRTDEYKVMMITYFMIEQPVHSAVFVYTLGINSYWRLIKGTSHKINYPYHHGLVNGALHWMTSGIPDSSKVVPISFDFGDEKFRELFLPKSFSQDDTNHPMGLGELSGFLSLYHCKADENFDIWVMKVYGDEQSWTKVFSVAQPISSGIQGLFKPLCILKKDVVLGESDIGIFILDVVKNECRQLHLRYPPYAFGTEMYLESLVSLGTDGGVDVSNKHGRKEKEGGRLAEEAKSD
ncbi:F-box protein CPR1-like [Telopea speciosissima]|uniref:F-box protein CPR1-like n=1 Tax=Telopea speciosissima TaxID=54955 RepID=UPI001CC693BD|nr:F-box protein CPR1-like [Telopea speciosissima]